MSYFRLRFFCLQYEVVDKEVGNSGKSHYDQAMTHGATQMNVDQAISDVSALPPMDQLRVVQAIWDRLPAEIGIKRS